MSKWEDFAKIDPLTKVYWIYDGESWRDGCEWELRSGTVTGIAEVNKTVPRYLVTCSDGRVVYRVPADEIQITDENLKKVVIAHNQELAKRNAEREVLELERTIGDLEEKKVDIERELALLYKERDERK